MNNPETQRRARLAERKLAVPEAVRKSLRHQAFTGSGDRLSHGRAGLIT